MRLLYSKKKIGKRKGNTAYMSKSIVRCASLCFFIPLVLYAFLSPFQSVYFSGTISFVSIYPYKQNWLLFSNCPYTLDAKLLFRTYIHRSVPFRYSPEKNMHKYTQSLSCSLAHYFRFLSGWALLRKGRRRKKRAHVHIYIRRVTRTLFVLHFDVIFLG